MSEIETLRLAAMTFFLGAFVASLFTNTLWIALLSGLSCAGMAVFFKHPPTKDQDNG